MRPRLGLALVIAACSGGDEAVPIDAGPDAPTDGGDGCLGCDAPEACAPWRLVDATATGLALVDDSAPVAGRSFRLDLTYVTRGADLPAIPAVEVAGATVTVRARMFEAPVGQPPAVVRHAHVVLSLAPGTYAIAAPGVAPLTVTVGAAPPHTCGAPGACVLDCDCDQRAGERCLSGVGLGGPFRACARSCDTDRDCGGAGRCDTVPDDLPAICRTDAPECDATRPCPVGFTCTAGACAPDFTLDSGSRHACGCDADCEPGLRCVGTPGAARCQAVCLSDGAWCQGAHVCGPASADLGGLATSDSACGWLGE